VSVEREAKDRLGIEEEKSEEEEEKIEEEQEGGERAVASSRVVPTRSCEPCR